VPTACHCLHTVEYLAPALLANGQYPCMSVTNAFMSMTLPVTPVLYGRGVIVELLGGGGAGVRPPPDSPDPVMSTWNLGRMMCEMVGNSCAFIFGICAG
jgi:hypothetical protein